MKLILILCISLISFALGCSQRDASNANKVTSLEVETPDVVRVVCDSDGARAQTKKVKARSDGLHVELNNRLSGKADLSINHADGGMGWSVPAGRSKRVANVPPGKVDLSCYSPSWDREKAMSVSGTTIKVLAGDSGYKSTKLDCPREKKTEPYTKEETEEQKGNLVEIFRHDNSDSLREGDIVEIAGNIQSADEKTVRVVRDGKVVATAHYLKFSTGWAKATDENCVGF